MTTTTVNIKLGNNYVGLSFGVILLQTNTTMIDFNNNELSIMVALCREQLNNQTGLYVHETLVNIISKIEKHLYDKIQSGSAE